MTSQIHQIKICNNNDLFTLPESAINAIKSLNWYCEFWHIQALQLNINAKWKDISAAFSKQKN